jgi:peptidoglycan/xylan/chitin deacetylase (PgdA/CDA1 family)
MLNSRTVNIVFTLFLFICIISDVFAEVSLWIYMAIAMAYLVFQVYGSTILSAQFFLPVKYKSDFSSNGVALTFDDGPIPGKTELILDILKTHKIPAAFFCIGHRAKEHPELVQRIHAEGHLIGNHSYWHGKMFDLQSSDKISTELQDTDEMINKCIGVKPRFFRPPYGVTNPMVASAVKKGNYTTIGWSVRSFDTVIKDKAKLMQRVTSSLKVGDIIIFHDYSIATIEMLPALLDHLLNTGLKIVRVDELLNEKAYVGN